MRAMLFGICLLGALAITSAGVKPFYDTTPFTPGVSHRQNMCARFLDYENNNATLRDGLRGLQLRPIIAHWRDDYEIFRYNNETGIDDEYSGIVVKILDDLAERAGFSWKESFAVMPRVENTSISDQLEWAVETYDMAIDWFTRTPERMERGVAFLDPWRDGTIILVAKKPKPKEPTPSLWSFMKPFNAGVWGLIVLTVIISAMTNQFIEHMHGDRDERSLWQWTSDNLYLSAINFSQNFEYGPTSLGGRIFAVSMTLWALLITATYTANLASLLVVSTNSVATIDSIEQAILLNEYICTWGGSAADDFVRKEYPEANRIALPEIESYQAVQEGRCVLLVTNKDPFLLYKGDKRYNPTCELEAVGRDVRPLGSGFAVNTDVGRLCTSFIRSVLNVHMQDMANEGQLEMYKAEFREIFQAANPANCGSGDNEDDGGERRLAASPTPREDNLLLREATRFSRKLKSSGGAAGGAAAAASGGDGEDSLNVSQMLGTFVLHWILSGVAVLVSVVNAFYGDKEEEEKQSSQSTPAPTVSETDLSRVDWEARYAQLSEREKTIVNVLFQIGDNYPKTSGVPIRVEHITHNGYKTCL